MRTWSGLVALGLMGLGAAAIAAPIKVTDLGSPIMVESGQRPKSGAVVGVANGKNAVFGFHPGDLPVVGSSVAFSNGVVGSQLEDRSATTINRYGAYVTTGAIVANKWTHHSGAQLHKNGTITPVPGIEGYNHVAVNHLNDAGVMVGYFARFWPDGDLFSDKPFYRRGDQVWSPTDLGAMYRVNNKGIALAGLVGIGGGLWSPETGFQSIPEFSTNEGIPDFNDSNEVLQRGFRSDLHMEIRIVSTGGRRVVQFPVASGVMFRQGDLGGFNNRGQITISQRPRDADGVFRNHWLVHQDNAWVDLTQQIRTQIPSSWALDKFGDIDDYGVAYGTATLPDGTKTVLMIETVPEPGTLAALGLGALLLRRRKR